MARTTVMRTTLASVVAWTANVCPNGLDVATKVETKFHMTMISKVHCASPQTSWRKERAGERVLKFLKGGGGKHTQDFSHGKQ